MRITRLAQPLLVIVNPAAKIVAKILLVFGFFNGLFLSCESVQPFEERRDDLFDPVHPREATASKRSKNSVPRIRCVLAA